MNAVAKAIERLVSHTQDEVNPEQPGDYFDEEGLLRCGICSGRKQKHVVLFGRDYLVPVLCKCGAERYKEEEERAHEAELKIQARRLRSLSLMPRAFYDCTFESYVVRDGNENAYSIGRKYVDKFQEMYRKNQGLLFYGTVGTGKTYTAACIANELMSKGVNVVMTSFVQILQELGNSDNANILNIVNGADLLIADDLGAERSTDYAMEKVYGVVDTRVRLGRPMILTTNMSLENMKRPPDIKYARIYDRIFGVCYPVKMSGRSMRLDEGNNRFREMKALFDEGS